MKVGQSLSQKENITQFLSNYFFDVFYSAKWHDSRLKAVSPHTISPNSVLISSRRWFDDVIWQQIGATVLERSTSSCFVSPSRLEIMNWIKESKKYFERFKTLDARARSWCQNIILLRQNSEWRHEPMWLN